MPFGACAFSQAQAPGRGYSAPVGVTAAVADKWGSSGGLRSGLPGAVLFVRGGRARDTSDVRSPALMLERCRPGFSRGGLGSAVQVAPLGVSVV